jgi:hypothetical protein
VFVHLSVIEPFQGYRERGRGYRRQPGQNLCKLQQPGTRVTRPAPPGSVATCPGCVTAAERHGIPAENTTTVIVGIPPESRVRMLDYQPGGKVPLTRYCPGLPGQRCLLAPQAEAQED